jgi:hypothetical protein
MIRPVNMSSQLNRTRTMNAVVRNCQGEIKEPQMNGLLKFGSKYRYMIRAAEYRRTMGNFTYMMDNQELFVNM